MPRRLWIATLTFWPGLSQIWSGQEALGLILAGLFALALNGAIATQFIYDEMLGSSGSTFLLALAVTIWTASTIYSLWWVWRCHPERFRRQIDQLYRDGQQFYLQGRWNESRRCFERILILDETDADALLMMGLLFERTAQSSLARRAYRQCLELESGSKWRWEVEQYLTRIADPPASTDSVDPSTEGQQTALALRSPSETSTIHDMV